MPSPKSSFFDKILGRIDRLNVEGLQTVVQRLARERSFLEVLFNTIEDGVLVVDKNGVIVYFNQAVTRLLGIASDAGEGQMISRYLPGIDWVQLCRSQKEDNAKRVIRHEFEVSYPRLRFLRMYASPIDGGVVSGPAVVVILHDATEVRQQTFDTIESERVQALTLLAASVAHEVGNPLNALNIHLQLIERELKRLSTCIRATQTLDIKEKPQRTRLSKAVPETDLILQRVAGYLNVAKGEIARLDYIVTQFLQAIRPSQLSIKLDSLNQVIEAALDLLAPELENRGLMVEDHRDKELPNAPIDAAQLKQVLVNLIKNAMQAMTKGGTLTLKTGHNSEAVWLSVGDTGGGIPPEIVERIFEPFYTTKQKGSGLGLMIVQRIVREHGGRIDLDSRVGVGTTFRIWFPLHEPEPKLLADGTNGTGSKNSPDR